MIQSQWSLFKAVAVGGALVGMLAAGAIVIDAYRDLKADIATMNRTIGQLEVKSGAVDPLQPGQKPPQGTGQPPKPSPSLSPPPASPAPLSPPRKGP
jgi:hypothetical protein